MLVEKCLGRGDVARARKAQLELAALGVRCRLQLLNLLRQRRADLLVVGRAYLLGRFLPLPLVVGLRVALLPLLLLALRLRAILLTVHGDRLPFREARRKSPASISHARNLSGRHKRGHRQERSHIC